MDQRPQSEDIAIDGPPADLHEVLTGADALLAAAAEDAGGRAAAPEPPPPAQPVPTASEQPTKRAKAPTKAERQIKAWMADKDQIESAMAARRADRTAREESAIAAIRQIEAERDADFSRIDAEQREDEIIVGGLIAAIEKAVAANGGAA